MIIWSADFTYEWVYDLTSKSNQMSSLIIFNLANIVVKFYNRHFNQLTPIFCLWSKWMLTVCKSCKELFCLTLLDLGNWDSQHRPHCAKLSWLCWLAQKGRMRLLCLEIQKGCKGWRKVVKKEPHHQMSQRSSSQVFCHDLHLQSLSLQDYPQGKVSDCHR